ASGASYPAGVKKFHFLFASARLICLKYTSPSREIPSQDPFHESKPGGHDGREGREYNHSHYPFAVLDWAGPPVQSASSQRPDQQASLRDPDQERQSDGARFRQHQRHIRQREADQGRSALEP